MRDIDMLSDNVEEFVKKEYGADKVKVISRSLKNKQVMPDYNEGVITFTVELLYNKSDCDVIKTKEVTIAVEHISEKTIDLRY